MNKPENEMLLAVLEAKTLKNGSVIFTGFLGMNTIYANEYNGKLFIKLQKWPKKEKNQYDQTPTFNGNEADVDF